MINVRNMLVKFQFDASSMVSTPSETNEPHHEKIWLRGIQPGPTQTVL